MKLTLLFVSSLIMVTLLLAGCSSTKYVCVNGDVVDNADECQEEQETPTIASSPYQQVIQEQDVQEEPKANEDASKELAVAQNDVRIQETLLKAKKVSSVKYRPVLGHKVTQEILEVFTTRDKMRIILREDEIKENSIDTVIFDLKTKSALGYCESEKRCTIQGKLGTVNFETYYVPTPFDWLDKVNGATIEREEVISRRKVFKITTEGKQEMWLDQYFGIPLKVIDGNKSYTYDDMKFNNVKDSDIEFNERD